MFSLAALYVMLDAQFIGVIQVLVYAGAIMVVFLFVIMLLNLGHPSELARRAREWWKLAAGAGRARAPRGDHGDLARRVAARRSRCRPATIAAQVEELRRRRHDRRAAVQRVPARVRAHERAAARRHRRARWCWASGRAVPMLAESLALSRGRCSRSASSACSPAATRSSSSCASS